MNRGTLFLVSAAALGAVALWLSSARSDAVVAEGRALVAAGATLVDVRTPAEFAAGHVRGAVNIPVDDLERRLSELGPTSQPVVLYCRSGRRSARAKRLLQSHGYEQVLDVGPTPRW